VLANPSYWLWLLAVLGGGYATWRIWHHAEHIIRVWFDTHEYRHSYPQTKFYLRAGGLFFLALALLGPYIPAGGNSSSTLSREIYFLIDVSASMNCEDVRPTRLRKVKREVKELLKSLAGDKVGLIVFTDNAFVQCPLTSDIHTVEMFLDMVETHQFTQTGTNFRSALSVALDSLTSSRKGRKEVSQGIILISDGEDFGEGFGSVADRLRENYIKVFAVGVGTYEGTPVPRMQGGQANGFYQLADGGSAVSRLTDDRLRELADMSGTSYTAIQLPHEGLASLQEQLYSLSYSPAARAQEKVEANTYQIFLLIALILLGASMVIMPIRAES